MTDASKGLPGRLAAASIPALFIEVAVRSVDEVGEVSLPQMRLLFALRDEGQSSCTHLAQVLGVSGSSVTRLADRLVVSGHVTRAGDPGSRSRVLLALTDHGTEVIEAVLAWRSRELSRALHSLAAFCSQAFFCLNGTWAGEFPLHQTKATAIRISSCKLAVSFSGRGCAGSDTRACTANTLPVLLYPNGMGWHWMG